MARDSVNRWARLRRTGWVFGYAAVIGVFLCAMARFYQPGIGFNYLVAFGAKQNLPQISELKPLNYLLEPDGYGYDAQYYAQIAMHPGLRSPELRQAVDSLPYRARRILMCWTAYAAGLGRPVGILQAFAMQNMVAWLLLAAVLLRWFPPTGAGNLLRWGGVLFCAGVCQSLRMALVDGPSLLLICVGVWGVETNRRWLATGVFAVSGLARETSLLGAAALIRPEQRNLRHLRELAIRAALVAAPLALWLVYVHVVTGPVLDAGERNFNAPFFSYVTHWRHTLAGLAQRIEGDPWPQANLLVMIALTTQFCFLALRPRPQEPWWRVGACFAVLMVVLGTAVWEGYPGAAPRVLLPMQVAFNVLVPRSRRWFAVLVLGNLSLLAAPNFLEPPADVGLRLTGAQHLLASADGRRSARVSFDRRWHGGERRNERYWRWSRGDAAFTVTNPQPAPVLAAIEFFLDGVDERRVTVSQNGRVVWSGGIGATAAKVDLESIVLAPGETVFQLTSDRPPRAVSGVNPREIAFAVRNLEVRFLREAAKP